jgi:hypothetical protein
MTKNNIADYLPSVEELQTIKQFGFVDAAILNVIYRGKRRGTHCYIWYQNDVVHHSWYMRPHESRNSPAFSPI